MAPAEDRPPAPHASTAAWHQGVARLGSVEVDAVTRSVIATGWVNQTEGAVEVLACGPRGKTHESLLVLNVSPLDLQAGLLLLGLIPGKPMIGLGQGPPDGPAVDVWIEWDQEDGKKRARAERLLFNREANDVLPETHWTFTGSLIEEGKFRALTDETMIATYWDPWAIVNLPLPCGSNDEIIAVHTASAPPWQAPVRVIIKALNRNSP